MRLILIPLCLLLVLSIAGPVALASSGDRSDEFRLCVDKCARHTCASADGLRPLRAQPLALWLTRWTCRDDCKYACMHSLTDLAQESGARRMQQFYGKWPFWRFAGMQEPAAVAFSFANLLMHVLGADWLRRGMHPAHPMRPFFLTWAYMNINAWIWSAVFHTRGTCFFIAVPHFILVPPSFPLLPFILLLGLPRSTFLSGWLSPPPPLN